MDNKNVGEGSSGIPSLKKVTSGISTSFSGRIINAVLSYVNLVLIARILSTENFGIYSFAIYIIGFLVVFSNFGLQNTLIYLLPKRKVDGSYKDTFFTSLYFNIIFSIFIVLAMFVSIPQMIRFFPEFDRAQTFIRILALSIPFQSLIIYFKAVNQTNYDYIKSTIPEFIVRPILFFLSLLFLYLYKPDENLYVLYAYLLSYLVPFVFALYWGMQSAVPHLGKQWKFKIDKSFFRLSPQFLSIQLLNKGNVLVITLLIGIFLSPEDVGFFRVSERSVQLVLFALTSLNTVFAPMISSLYAQNKLRRLGEVYQTSTKWILALGGSACIFMIVGADWIMMFFGQEFTEATLLLVVLSIGQLVNAATGSCGYIVMMTGRQKLLIWNRIFTLIFIFVFTIAGVQFMGLLAAGLAFSLGQSLSQIVLVFTVKKHLQITPISKRYLGTLLSLLITTGISLLLKNLIATPFLWLNLILLGLVLAVVFLFPYYFFGMDQKERAHAKSTLGLNR
ncbi:MAG TPA: flippase [Bacillales bacterium]